MLSACVFIPDFPLGAVVRHEPGLRSAAVAMVEGAPPSCFVIAANAKARQMGVAAGMTRLEASQIPSLEIRRRSPAEEASAHAALLDLGWSFSPRLEDTAPGTVVIDLEGLDQLFGSSEKIARRLARGAARLGLEAQVAVSSNLQAAVQAARGLRGITVIPEGREAEMLAGIPVDLLVSEAVDLTSSSGGKVQAQEALASTSEILDTLYRWGIHTFGDLAALPTADLAERLGQEGVGLQRLARGQGSRTLVLAQPEQHFEEVMEFEDSLDLLDPLMFILGRLLDSLCARLRARSLATNEMRLTLTVDRCYSSAVSDSDRLKNRLDHRQGTALAAPAVPKAPRLSQYMRGRPSPPCGERGNREAVGEGGCYRTDSLAVPQDGDQNLVIENKRIALRHGSSRALTRTLGAFFQQAPEDKPAYTIDRQQTADDRPITRTLTLPVPTVNTKTLLKLWLLHLQADPPPAPVLKAVLEAIPAKPRPAQGGLFRPLAPDPEKLEITLARIAGVVGKEKVGSPEILDTHRPGAFRMQRFHAEETSPSKRRKDRRSTAKDQGFLRAPDARLALRVFRPPRPATVEIRGEVPVRVYAGEIRGDVVARGGPWRTSGEWWGDAWEQEEWDVEVRQSSVISAQLLVVRRNSDFGQEQNTRDNEQGPFLYRLYRDIATGQWFVRGVYD